MDEDNFLQLGDFIFEDMELPESISFGGPQRVAVKRLIGGARVVDALGTDPKPISWSGNFVATLDGQYSPLDRALMVQQMKDAGLPVYLYWDEFAYQVVISEFEADYKFAHIPYRISCEIVVDMTVPVIQGQGMSLDDQMNGDLNSANSLGSAIGNSSIGSALSSVTSAINNVASFATSGLKTIATVQQSVTSGINTVQSVINSTDSVLSSLGIKAQIPGIPALQRVATLNSMLNAANAQSSLTQLSGTLGRISRNLSSVQMGSTTTVTTSGNLYSVAANQYGDATAWPQIAQANNITDPNLYGFQSLNIPPYNSAASGGVAWT